MKVLQKKRQYRCIQTSSVFDITWCVNNLHDTNFVVSSFYLEMWKFRFENKISLLRRGGIKYMKKHVCFSIAFGCRRVNFYCHWTVICDSYILYVQKLRNQINKLTAIYVLLNRYDIQRKYLGSLAPCRPCTYNMASDLQVNFIYFLT